MVPPYIEENVILKNTVGLVVVPPRVIDETSFEALVKRVQQEHLRAYRVSPSLYRVVSAGSRVYTHPSRFPERRRGLKHTKRAWNYIACIKLGNGRLIYLCRGEHCAYRRDANGSTACKHAVAVAWRHIRNPKEAEEVPGIPEALQNYP